MANLTEKREIANMGPDVNRLDVLAKASSAPETRQQLETILKNKDLDPALAEAIRAQIAAMDNNQSPEVVKEPLPVAGPETLDSISSVEMKHTIEEGQFITSSGDQKLDLQAFMNRLNNPTPEDLDINKRLN